MRSANCLRTAAVLAVISGFFLPVSGDVPRVIYSTIQTSPTSDVPGLSGIKFDADTTGFSRPYRSANGKFWIMEAFLEVPTVADDEIILLGSGLAGTVVVREGQQAPWAPDGHLIGPIREKMGVNNQGRYAFGQNLAGTAPTAADEQINLWDGTQFIAVATEGSAGPAGESYGAILHSASIANDGRVLFVANSTVGALPASQDDFILLDGAIMAQSGIAGTPAGQVASETWNLFDSDDNYVSGNGETVFMKGTLTGSTASNVAIAINNQVVFQESVIYPPLTAGISTLSEGVLTPDGNWLVRGETAGDAENFVMHNGVVVAITDTLVPGTTTGETWDDTRFGPCFFTMASNAFGDIVYGGLTSEPDTTRDAAVALHNVGVILRENDGVDLDGNGLADDDTLLHIFNNDDMFLDNNKILWFTAELRNSGGTVLGQAFLRFVLPICPGDLNCDGTVNFADIDYFVLALTAVGGWDEAPEGACYWRAGDLNGDLNVDFDDIDGFVLAVVKGACPS